MSVPSGLIPASIIVDCLVELRRRFDVLITSGHKSGADIFSLGLASHNQPLQTWLLRHD